MLQVNGYLGEKILLALPDAPREVSFPELYDALKQNGMDDRSTIKAAVWKLISDGVIELTSERRLLKKTNHT